MSRTILALIITTLWLPLAAGCSSNQGVVRGQSPHELGPSTMLAGDSGGYSADSPYCSDCSDGNCYGGECCEESCGRRHGLGLKHLCPLGRHCRGQGCPGCCGAPAGLLSHDHHWAGYGPYAGMMDWVATVQYPYYTCKGPDCFFYQGH